MSEKSFSIATWNVNSVRRRIQGLGWFADESGPDIICLQETKVTDELFPSGEIAAIGYPHQAFTGMKGYNGVAILSKLPLRQIEIMAWGGKAEPRHIYALVDGGGRLGEVEVHSLYVPAGGDIPDPLKNPKFAYKLDFLADLTNWWAARGVQRGKRVLVGDFNVAPLVTDVWSHARLKNVVTHTEIEVQHLAAFQKSARWVDAMRLIHPETKPLFTWWSYRAQDGESANKGRRLDHVWVSPDLADRVSDVTVARETRDWDPPSDHVPVILKLSR